MTEKRFATYDHFVVSHLCHVAKPKQYVWRKYMSPLFGGETQFISQEKHPFVSLINDEFSHKSSIPYPMQKAVLVLP